MAVVATRAISVPPAVACNEMLIEGKAVEVKWLLPLIVRQW